ncbi:hypothetical protein [Tautonia sociabilis]|uniref:hypothetical protein n=1 Tax=Tautonia sociabilis TaxID=2080755 RepID=UPI0013155F06|nr:hypothetical protein [Tautonia sociabilis]
MIRLTVIGVALLVAAGCEDQADRTPTAEPVEYADPVEAAGDEGPIPTGPEPRRIETH